MNKNAKVARQLLCIARMLVADKAKEHNQFYTTGEWEQTNEQYPIEKTDELFGTILDFIKSYQSNMDAYCQARKTIAQKLAMEAKRFVDEGNKLSKFDDLDKLIEAQGMISQWCVAAQESNAYGGGQYNQKREIQKLDDDATFDDDSGLWIPSPDSAITKSKENWRDYITKFMRKYAGRFAPKFALFVQRITASFPEEQIDTIRTNFAEWGKGTLLESDDFKAKIRYILSSQHGDVEIGKAMARMENVNSLLKARGVVGQFNVTTRKFLGDIVDANGDIIAYASIDAPCVQKIEELGDKADEMVDELNEQIREYKQNNPKSKKKELEHTTDQDSANRKEENFGEWDDDIDASANNGKNLVAARKINAGFVDGLKNFWYSAKNIYDKVVDNVKSFKQKLLSFLRNVQNDMNECEQANTESVNALKEGHEAMIEFINAVNEKATELGYGK